MGCSKILGNSWEEQRAFEFPSRLNGKSAGVSSADAPKSEGRGGNEQCCDCELPGAARKAGCHLLIEWSLTDPVEDRCSPSLPRDNIPFRLPPCQDSQNQTHRPGLERCRPPASQVPKSGLLAAPRRSLRGRGVSLFPPVNHRLQAVADRQRGTSGIFALHPIHFPHFRYKKISKKFSFPPTPTHGFCLTYYVCSYRSGSSLELRAAGTRDRLSSMKSRTLCQSPRVMQCGAQVVSSTGRPPSKYA